MSIREAASEAQANLCEDTLDNLTLACREMAKEGGGPIDLSLALCCAIGGISWSLQDRPVYTSEIKTLSRRLDDLFATLKAHGVSEESRAAIVAALEELRDLL